MNAVYSGIRTARMCEDIGEKTVFGGSLEQRWLNPK